MRSLFLPIIILRGIIRAIQGYPADLMWTAAAQAARAADRARRRHDRRRPAPRPWYPKD